MAEKIKLSPQDCLGKIILFFQPSLWGSIGYPNHNSYQMLIAGSIARLEKIIFAAQSLGQRKLFFQALALANKYLPKNDHEEVSMSWVDNVIFPRLEKIIICPRPVSTVDSRLNNKA